ncbi:MAG: type IV toxin-antitoxin system AbiEi family antitoxin domain-containing protein [Burkholderiaceae bacterium]
MGLQKDEKLNSLLKRLPEGVAAPSSWLADQGYSRQLVRKYVQGNWLQALGRGVYARPQGSMTWQGVVLGMQRLAGLSFYVGGVSALNRQGFAHYLPLGGENTIHLWGRGKVPAWVRAVSLPESLRFHTVRLFADDAASVGITEVSSKVRDWVLQVSAPERAILELLSLVGTTETSFTHAAELFAGLTSLRPDVINTLLTACSSIKVKRLFLFLADHHNYPWFSKVAWRQLDLGSGKRAITKGGMLDKQFMITVPESFRGQS